MARIRITIPNGQISRIKASIEESRRGMMDMEEDSLDLSTDELVVDHMKLLVKQYVKSFIGKNERQKAKRDALGGITIDAFEVEDEV